LIIRTFKHLEGFNILQVCVERDPVGIEPCILTFALIALPSLQCCGCWQYGILPIPLHVRFQKQILPEYTCWMYTDIESELANLKWDLYIICWTIQ